MFQWSTTKLMLSYLFHDYESALESARHAEKNRLAVRGFFGSSIFHFYSSLARIAGLDGMAPVHRFRTLRRIRRKQKKFLQWSRRAPANFLPKWHLVEAEMARHGGRTVKAIGHYEQAIGLSREYNFPQEEALACELAGQFYLACGMEGVAKVYLGQAQQGYRRWGALAKVQDLARRYPQWLSENPVSQPSYGGAAETISMTASSSAGTLDFATIMKASQALSQEIVLERLLKRLMQVVMESAGAQRARLLLKKDNAWYLEAEKAEAHAEATVLQSLPLASLPHRQTPLPLSLVHYVSNARESIVIHEAVHEKLLADDPYVQAHRPRSLLGVPILHHGELTGMLYLENNAASGAFTENRLEVLHLLASQAAISIENARLYADMEERVAARTSELRAMSLRDGLTGVANRRAFDEKLEEELGRSSRNGRPLSLLIIDIDHFKAVNDSYGHPVGDACLKLMGAALLAECRRPSDFVARYGGEEFALILSDTDAAQAAHFAEQVRAAVQKIVLQVGDIIHPVTASIGVAQAKGKTLLSAAALIASADRCLYAAKAAGRNRVMVAGQVEQRSADSLA